MNTENYNPLARSKKKVLENKISFSNLERLQSDYYDKISELQKDDIIVKASCKFCNHPGRADAEEHWEKRQNYESVKRFFDKYEETNEIAGHLRKMNFINIKGHLDNHYSQQEKRIWMREYGGRVLSIINRKIDHDSRLEVLGHQLEMQLNEIAADPHEPPVKKADAMVKLAKMISELMIIQAKLRGELKSVNIVTDKLTNVWVDLITTEQNIEVRTALQEGLDKFQGKLEGVPLISEEVQ